MTTVIDTNLWISALISQKMRERLELLIENPNLLILASPVLLAEIETVALRPKFSRYVSQETAFAFLDILRNRLDIIFPHSNIKGFIDLKDDFLLAIATDGGADFLVTGDKSLLETQDVEGIRIISLEEFEKILF